MIWSQPWFLYYLPLLIVPLLISLQKRLNRSHQDFASNMLLEEIIRKHQRTQSANRFFRQLLRVLTLVFIILAFAGLVPDDRDKAVYLLIDPGISMSTSDLDQCRSFLETRYSIREVYVGSKIWETGRAQPVLELGDTDIPALLRSLPLRLQRQDLIFLTDGQSYQFQQPLAWEGRLTLLLLTNKQRNIYVSHMYSTPPVSIENVKTGIDLEIGGDIRPDDRVSVYLNDTLLHQSAVKRRLFLTKFVRDKGLNQIKVVLEGDDFLPDNEHYFPLIHTAIPRVYYGIDSLLMRKVIDTVFPSIRLVKHPALADIILDTVVPLEQDRLVFVFPEDKDKFESSLYRNFGSLYPLVDKEVKGSLSSAISVMDILGEMALRLSYDSLPGIPELSLDKDVLITRHGHLSLFGFNLQDNEPVLSQSLLLLFYFNEAVIRYYTDKWLLINSRSTLHETDRLIQRPGIYPQPNNKYSVINVERESEWKFRTKQELQREYPHCQVLYYDELVKAPVRNRGLISILIMLLSLGLFLWDRRT